MTDGTDLCAPCCRDFIDRRYAVLILPIETPDHSADALIVVLTDANLDRMKVADPAEVVLRQMGKRLVNPTVLLCHEADGPELQRVLQTRDVTKIIAHLQRGLKFRPEKGDHDRGPERMGDHQ